MKCTHSPDVSAWLEGEGGDHIALSRVTPRSVVAKSVQNVTPGLFRLVISVDGVKTDTAVRLRGFRNRRASLFAQASIGQVAREKP